MTPIPTYRTQLHRTDRILKDWILKERLAFDRAQSFSVSELAAVLPKLCKEQLGKLKPTDAVFRKLSSGFNNVSDVWIELMRFIGVEDFSAEQAIFGTVSVFLDKENVRVKLRPATDEPSRENSIEVFCLNEPNYQGTIAYEGDRLSFPPSIFDAVIERRLNVYNLNCEYLSNVLFIPDSVIAEQNATDAKFKAMVENATLIGEFRSEEDNIEFDRLEAERSAESATNARLEAIAEDEALLESGREMVAEIGNSPIDPAELEVERNEEARKEAYLEAIATAEDANALRMAEVYSDASTALVDDNDTEF